ncbi:MAG: class I SAM-dependent methyltransferase [Myxococcota bacterium]
MKRLHLVELEDLPWFPAIVRDGGTAYLELIERLAGHPRLLAKPLADIMLATGEQRITDLCSGGGGPLMPVVDALVDRGIDVHVTLTDAFPNVPSLSRVASQSDGRIEFFAQPVDATAVPAELKGVRTLFNAFHHFRPDVARRILQDAVTARRPIAIFEFVNREPLTMLALALSTPLAVTLTMPAWRPFRWPWVLLTWGLPIMQLFTLWDGLVSCLRVYSEDELDELVRGLDAAHWHWDIGRIKLGDTPVRATYLTGYPRS